MMFPKGDGGRNTSKESYEKPSSLQIAGKDIGKCDEPEAAGYLSNILSLLLLIKV